MSSLEMYVFQCQDCHFVYAELFDPMDRFSKYPECPDCGFNDIEVYNGDLPPEISKAIDEYNTENKL